MMDAQSNRGSTGQLSTGSMIGGSMHHSFSTPAGVDGGANNRTPPPTPKKGGKMLAMRVQMLDDTVTIFQVQAKAIGRVLFDQVCKQLHLLEADYFGLEYMDNSGTRYWLDLQKPLTRQLGLSLVDPLLYFCVKFYTPDPAQLEEEFTRYLFCLQIKRDLAQGVMQCNENTAALLSSYLVQAECGDYVCDDYPDHTYLSTYKFIPSQDHEMERKIMENHKKHAGQSPAEADVNLLETARRCEFYGIKLHAGKNHENTPLNLAVAHMGIVVFQNYTKINTFSWAKIRKISFKRKRFLIKLHPEGYQGLYKDTVEFLFEGRNECKNFWKKCVENHGFFRCSTVKHISRHKTRVLSRGSSFRYSGKTQKQIIEFVRDNYVKRQTFQRSASFRHSSAHSSASNMHSSTVGNSISVHPLLPLGDSNLTAEAVRLSASLGSMARQAASSTSGFPTTTKSVSRPHTTPTIWSSENREINGAEPIEIRRHAHQKMTNSPSPPQTTRSTTPSETSATTSPQQHTTVEIIGASDAARNRQQHDVHAAPVQTGITHATRMPSNNLVKSEGSLDRTEIFTNKNPYHPASQTQSQNDVDTRKCIISQPRRLVQRSSSCKELHDFSFEETGQTKRRPKPIPPNKTQRKLESPITRYDDHKLIYSTTSHQNSLEIHQDMSDQKVYSSSYPGTTAYSHESMEDPGNYDLRDSQEDVSHDSYELLERSDDEFSNPDERVSRKHEPQITTRSCSLDSGNYFPSDTDSDGVKHPKSKSSSDVHHDDIFMMEDPRDFPREIIPRKSDGCFYKTFKQQNSRTSSLESKSDYYESRNTSKSSKESLKKRASLSSRTSSQESKSDFDEAKAIKRNKSADNLEYRYESRTSSMDSQSSEYYDAMTHKTSFERNYGTMKPKIKQENITPTHVHSMSVQNVETEQTIRGSRSSESSLTTPTQPITITSSKPKTTHIWPEHIHGMPTEIADWSSSKPSTEKSTDSESNIFSFDEDAIQSLQNSENYSRIVPDIDLKSNGFKDVFIEIEPKKYREPFQLHQPIERTKSDPNSLARQRINSNARRMLLMHQKSIDLTPAESSDEDYLYKQIPPSAPPIIKHRGTHFEMPPSAEFGHFDILKREIEGSKIKFEIPKDQLEELGAKTQSDFINLPPKNNEIPYVLHKRHVINGTAPSENETVKSPKLETAKPKSPIKKDETTGFLFTQNVDLSKIDPVTLEIDKTEKPIQYLSSPKRDITHIDPVLLETLNSKLSQIESDSPTSSRTESLKPTLKMNLQKEISKKSETIMKIDENVEEKPKPTIPPPIIKDKNKLATKNKRVIKPRMQPGKGKTKTNKTKVRITSFSSDDESLDSDDVFGSAEATPTRIEFSPPQMRKEMESILKFESERKYLQYTMSSTEVEGSPPQTRKKPDKTDNNDLDPVQTELRRISERSFSIPSSEDDFNIKTSEMPPVFDIPAPSLHEDGEKSCDETIKDQTLTEELIRTIAEDEIQKEKLLLQAEIENDIRDLRVPSRTKITEIMSPSMRKKGQSPVLFASARLNLSEGSAFTMLQKQQATESPIPGRRALSLDAPVIPVNRLPPLNSFSSKDDTVEEDNQDIEFTDTQLEIAKNEKKDEESPTLVVPEPKKLESDQTVPDVSTNKSKKILKPTVHTKPLPKIRPKTICTQKTPKEDPKSKSTKPTPPIRTTSKTQSVSSKPPPVRKTSPPTTSNGADKTQVAEDAKKQKERARSLEKIELKRISSKERTKSEESEEDISKRREKQQMLYETAIKQTKTLKSPVKDTLPVFPQVEETVRERHGKLEISINTIENTAVPLEEAIIITKSPKKLDKKIDKLTKSLELDLTDNENPKMQRLGKSLDLEMNSRSDSEFDFSMVTTEKYRKESEKEQEESEIVLEGTSLDVWLSVDEKPEPRVHENLENVTVIKSEFFPEGTCEKPPDIPSTSDSVNDDSVELQKASATVGKFLRKKLEARKIPMDSKPDLVKDLIRNTDENESSLTEVSADGHDQNLLYVEIPNRNTLHRLSIERSRSEDTGSWMTMECDEFVGTESSFDYEADTPETKEDHKDTLEVKPMRMDLLKRSSDQSRSSEGSWTSGEKELSPSNIKETDESSVSCSMGRVVGLSQPELLTKQEKTSPDTTEPPRSPRSPRSPRMSVLGRTFTMDEGFQRDEKSSSDEAYEIPRDVPPNVPETGTKPKKPYPFEEKWSNNSELTQKLHQRISKKLSSADKGISSSVEEPYGGEMKKNGRIPSKHSLHSIEKLSTESRTSLDTESSSGSFGAAVRLQKSGEIPRELSSTWRPFPLDSSGSESFDDGLLPSDQDVEKNGYFLRREDSGDFVQTSDVCKSDDVTPTQDGTELPEDLANFANNYQNIQEAVNINLHSVQPGFLSRTLSRISERSTNSEKSSLEDESTKVSTQSDSINESTGSSNPRGSISSESPSNAQKIDKKRSSEDRKELTPKNELPNFTNFLQRQISDDRRTSAEMAELSMDDIEIITSERGLKLRRQGSDDTIIDEECFEYKDDEKRNSSSQESEEWPLPEIPNGGQAKLMALHEIPSSDTSQLTTQVYQFANRPNIPKTFGLRGSFSLKSQDSEQWPSPPSSVLEPPLEGKVETYYVTPAEEACKVTVDSNRSTTQEDSNSDNENRTIDVDTEKTHTYENVATEQVSGSLSESLSVEDGGVKIVLPDKTEGSSDDENNISNLNDDVFMDASEGMSRQELRPPTVLRKSTTSDESSHSSLRKDGRRSSPSEEDCTSSLGTNLEDGTVRYALKPKCTHSSHSEDTSIALSLSEWSNSTNTVKFQNLSSNSGTKSSGLKSEENSLTDIAQSISEWSTQSKTQSASVQFQKLSTTSTTESTLTDLIPTLSDWSSSDSKNLVTDMKKDNFKEISTEDLVSLSRNLGNDIPTPIKHFTKSTERPVKIPVLSDTEKSSSSEQKTTVHTQRYDKDKQRYNNASAKGGAKTTMKLSKCSPYYSSSLSSESTPLPSSSPLKTATVPLMRTHRKPISKSLFQAKSPPSENDSTSSVESPKSKSERDRRMYRRKRQGQTQRKQKGTNNNNEEFIFVEQQRRHNDPKDYNEYLRTKNMEEMAANFQYENVLMLENPQLVHYTDEGYYPDGDSQSGSDIFRMEKDDDEKFEPAEGFDLSLIPPPLLEDDFEDDQNDI